MPKSDDLVAGVLACDPSELPSPSTPLRELDGWDSLKHVLLVVGIERHVKSKLTAEEIKGIVTVADVARILRDKGVDG